MDSWRPRWTGFLILGVLNEVGSWIGRVGLAKIDEFAHSPPRKPNYER